MMKTRPRIPGMRRPDAVRWIDGDLLLDSDQAFVVQTRRHPEGDDGRPVVVIAHERLSVPEIAGGLRAAADALEAV